MRFPWQKPPSFYGSFEFLHCKAHGHSLSPWDEYETGWWRQRCECGYQSRATNVRPHTKRSFDSACNVWFSIAGTDWACRLERGHSGSHAEVDVRAAA